MAIFLFYAQKAEGIQSSSNSIKLCCKRLLKVPSSFARNILSEGRNNKSCAKAFYRKILFLGNRELKLVNRELFKMNNNVILYLWALRDFGSIKPMNRNIHLNEFSLNFKKKKWVQNNPYQDKNVLFSEQILGQPQQGICLKIIFLNSFRLYHLFIKEH